MWYLKYWDSLLLITLMAFILGAIFGRWIFRIIYQVPKLFLKPRHLSFKGQIKKNDDA